MGFATRRDFTEYGGRISYDWITEGRSLFRQVSPLRFLGFAALRNEDNSLESALFEHDIALTWTSGAVVWTNLEYHYEDLREAIPFPDGTEIPTGSYTYYKFIGGHQMSPTRPFKANFYAGYGSFYDGWRTQFGI